MTFLEKMELGVIPLAGFATILLADFLPDKVGGGRILLTASALLLLQSLVRDLLLLARGRGQSSSVPTRKARCMCMESTIGAGGVLAGMLALGLGVDVAVAVPPWAWSILAVAVLGFGFWIKDYVIGWNPWRIEKDPDHMNIVFTWK